MCYYCEPCNAYVGCHNNTREPLGTMANFELRQARIKTHAAFDALWKDGAMSRGTAYVKLNEHFGRSIHIGESDIEMCNKIIEYITGCSAITESE